MILLIKVTFFTIFVVMFALRSGIRRYGLRVGWEAREESGTRYQFGQFFDRGKKFSGFILRFTAPIGYRLLVRRETALDRFAKMFHLADEPQVGDTDFDARFYIDCEDAAITSTLQAERDLRNVLRRLEIALRTRHATLREIAWEDGQLDVTIECRETVDEPAREREALQWLRPLVKAIHDVPRRTREQNDRAALPRWIYLSAWVIGAIGCTYVSEFVSDTLIYGDRFAFWSMQFSLLAFVAFFLFTFFRLGPIPRRPWLLVECTGIGIPGFILTGVLIARCIDVNLDTAAPQLIAVTRAQLYATTRGYRLSYHSEDHDISARSPLMLSEKDYRRMLTGWLAGEKNRDITILLHPGRLNFPWVEPSP